jgi:hypothetical protein
MVGRLLSRLSGCEAYDAARVPACWGLRDIYPEVVQLMVIQFAGVHLTFNFPLTAMWLSVDTYGVKH